MKKLISKSWMESFGEKFAVLNELRNEGRYCDITLDTFDDKKVKAHRNILHTGSGFFRDLFSSGMRDSNSDTIELRHMKFDLLEKVITFLYRGEIEVDNIENIEEIAQYANYLQVNELIEECTKFLSNQIDNNNCLKYWRLAQECYTEKFEKLCISHLLVNQLYEDDEFFNELCTIEIKTLYSDKRLKWSEEIKFEKILPWIKKVTKTNDEFDSKISEFLDAIKFSAMNEKFLITKVLGNSDLIGHEEIIKRIVKLTEKKWNMNNVDFTICLSLKNLRSGLCAIFDNEVVKISNEGEMNVFQKKKNCFQRFSYTTFNNCLIISGGEDNIKKISTKFCEYLPPATKEWKDFPSMLTPRAAHGCIYFNEKIYTCGGLKGSALSTIEFFDFGKEKWISGPEMKTERAQFGISTVDQSLYVIGGGWGAGNVEMLDPRSSDEWIEIHPKFQANHFTRCYSIGNDIYTFRNKDKPCIFDIRLNKFRDWEGEYYCTNLDQHFQVCEFNGFFIVLKRNHKIDYVDFYKYSLKGDLISSKHEAFNYSGWIGALFPLFYQN